MCRWSLIAMLVLPGMVVALPQAAAQGSGPGSSPAKPAPAAAGRSDTNWLSFDPATKTVKFQLIAGMTGGAKSPFNFNGFTDGELTLTVPENSTVVIAFENRDGTPHSAEVIADGPIPNMGGDPAIPKAYTKQVTEGLPQFGTDVMRFKAAPAAAYRLFCGVPGHGLSGMWIRFVVSGTAGEPTLQRAPGVP
jgi:hypothetical protein